jgi:hypothetical protein
MAARRIEVAMMTHHTESDDKGHVDISPEAAILPRARTLDGFALEAGEGIDMGSLESGTTLLIHTHNSQYRLVVLNPARRLVLVKGGRLFQDEAEARLNGSTCGGSTLKGGWIGVGFHLDLWAGGRRIITSSVRSVTVESVQ